MSYKDELIRIALLGTRQNALPESRGMGKLDAFLRQIRANRGKETELALLDSLAVISLYEKAARRPERFRGQMTAAEEDSRTKIKARSSYLLKVILESKQDLLPEFLHLLEEQNKIASDECLVALLDFGAQNPALRRAITACVGERAYWLSCFKPEWEFLRKSESLSKKSYDRDEIQKIWDYGTRAERLQVLTLARKQEPSYGLNLLRSCFKQENHDDRLGFLSCLSTGLSLDDEPFLEDCLDDKRKEIRTISQRLLLKLPQSQFSKRAQGRLLSVLNLVQVNEDGFKRGAQLSIDLSGLCHKSLNRDGLSISKSKDSRLGEKACLLAKVISQVNPRFVLEHLKLDESGLLECFAGSQWHIALFLGLEEAVVRFASDSLARRLLALQLGISSLQAPFPGLQDLNAVAAVAGKEGLEGLLADCIEKNGYLIVSEGKQDYNAIGLLMQLESPWSQSFSRLILRTVRTHMVQKNNFTFMDYIMRHIGKSMDLAVWSPVAETWSSCAQYHRSLETLIDMLAFRLEVIEAMKDGC